MDKLTLLYADLKNLWKVMIILIGFMITLAVAHYTGTSILSLQLTIIAEAMLAGTALFALYGWAKKRLTIERHFDNMKRSNDTKHMSMYG